MRRRAALIACFAVLAAALAAGGALAVSPQVSLRQYESAPRIGAVTHKVSLGQYESAPILSDGGSYTIGAFAVAKLAGKPAIVPGEGYTGIFYPDADECDELDLPLATPSIPISSRGKFTVSEKTPAGDSFVKVDWRGRWKQPGVVRGSITIKHDGCVSRHRWSGGKVG